VTGLPCGWSAGTQAAGEILELTRVAGVRGVEVLALRDETDPVVPLNAPALEDPLEGEPRLGVDDEQFVLVELDFQRELRIVGCSSPQS